MPAGELTSLRPQHYILISSPFLQVSSHKTDEEAMWAVLGFGCASSACRVGRLDVEQGLWGGSRVLVGGLGCMHILPQYEPEGTKVGSIICILELKYIYYYQLPPRYIGWAEENQVRLSNTDKHLLYSQTSDSSSFGQHKSIVQQKFKI